MIPEKLRVAYEPRDLFEALLVHQVLAKQVSRCESEIDNPKFFQKDLNEGKLDDYCGFFVAYHKGVLCGHSRSRETLFDDATHYYGKSNLSLFLVPPKGLESLVIFSK